MTKAEITQSLHTLHSIAVAGMHCMQANVQAIESLIMLHDPQSLEPELKREETVDEDFEVPQKLAHLGDPTTGK